jgi:hypothetical protein
MKYCYKGLNKQSSGVRERIIHFTLILMGKWFRFSNSLWERIMFDNRGSTVSGCVPQALVNGRINHIREF